jgi:hypothetical protein
VAQDPQYDYSGDDLSSLMMDPSAMSMMGQMDPNLMALLIHSMQQSQTSPQVPQAPTSPPLAPLGGESGSFMKPTGPVSLGDPDLFGLGGKMAPPYGGPAPAAATASRHYSQDYTPHGAADWIRILAPALLGIAGAAVGGPGGAAGAWQGWAKGAQEEDKRRMQQQALDQRTALLQANERRYREMERLRAENDQRMRDATGSQLLDKVVGRAMQFNDPEMQAFTLQQSAKQLAQYGYDTRKLLPEVSVRAKARLQKWSQAALDKGLANVEKAQGKALDYSVLFAPSDPNKPPVWTTPTDDGHTATFRQLAEWAGHDPDQYAQQLTKLKVRAPQNDNPDNIALMNAEMASFYKAHPERDPTPEETAQMRANVIQTIARARHITTPEERAEENIFGRTAEAQGRIFDIQEPELGPATDAAVTEAGTAIRAGKKHFTEIGPDVEGEQFLTASSLPEGTKALIRAVAQGRAQIPGGFGGAGLRTEFLALVTRFDPTFDVANPAARIQVRKDYTSGDAAKQVTALNTLMGHFDILGQAQDALKNGNVKAFNWLANSIMTQLGEPETNDYEVVADAVAKEATKVWRGTGGSESDIERYLKAFDSSNGPKIQSGAAADLAQLVESRLHALSDRYETGMGLTYEPPGGYWDPDTNPNGMKKPPSSWLLRPWARTAMDNVFRRADREPPTPPMPDLLRQQARPVTPGASAAPAAAPPAQTPGQTAAQLSAKPPVGPVAGMAPQAAPPPQAEAPMPRGGVEIPKTPQSIAAGRQVNAIATELQAAVKAGRSNAEVAEIRRRLQSAVNVLERMK